MRAAAVGAGSLAIGIAANTAVFVLFAGLTAPAGGTGAVPVVPILLGCAGALLLVGSALVAGRTRPPGPLLGCIAGIVASGPASLLAKALAGAFFPGPDGLAPLDSRASILAVGYIMPLIYFIWSFRYGKVAGPNPFRATGLEWQTQSPPLPNNFDVTPVVTEGAYEYSKRELKVV